MIKYLEHEHRNRQASDFMVQCHLRAPHDWHLRQRCLSREGDPRATWLVWVLPACLNVANGESATEELVKRLTRSIHEFMPKELLSLLIRWAAALPRSPQNRIIPAGAGVFTPEVGLIVSTRPLAACRTHPAPITPLPSLKVSKPSELAALNIQVQELNPKGVLNEVTLTLGKNIERPCAAGPDYRDSKSLHEHRAPLSVVFGETECFTSADNENAIAPSVPTPKILETLQNLDDLRQLPEMLTQKLEQVATKDELKQLAQKLENILSVEAQRRLLAKLDELEGKQLDHHVVLPMCRSLMQLHDLIEQAEREPTLTPGSFLSMLKSALLDALARHGVTPFREQGAFNPSTQECIHSFQNGNGNCSIQSVRCGFRRNQETLRREKVLFVSHEEAQEKGEKS